MRKITKAAQAQRTPGQDESHGGDPASGTREPARRVRASQPDARRGRERQPSGDRHLQAVPPPAIDARPASGGSAPPIAPGTVLGAKYRLIARLASGGMGSVWKAEHLHLEAPVAIKLMCPDGLAIPDRRTRFEREAKAGWRLRSPHVVAVHDYGVENGVPYMVMEHLEGEDLGARIRRRGRLEPSEVASIVTQIARALERTHAAGIVHRDLKPSNLFLARDGEEEIVKLLDFGVAKTPSGPASGDEATGAGMMLGSPPYMSPEHVRGAWRCDHRSDLWALGVIVFRMLTGALPFAGACTADLLVRICTEPVLSVRALVPTLPPALDTFLERALAREPEARFQSATAFAEALAAACAPRAGDRPPAVPRPTAASGESSSVASRGSRAARADAPPSRVQAPPSVPAPAPRPSGVVPAGTARDLEVSSDEDLDWPTIPSTP